MESITINSFFIDISDSRANIHSLELKFNRIEDEQRIFETSNNELKISVSINNNINVAHLIYKDPNIIDSDADIELRVLESAFEKKLELLEIAESGFDDFYSNDNDETNYNPYDPKLIRVDTKTFSVRMINDMINACEIDLSPAFQRHFVWNDITRKSRLIESLLLRIPLPAFYFSQDEEGLFQVVDGVQRLNVIHSFMNNEFKLKNLEYLHECEGKWFKEIAAPSDKSLDGVYVRRIEQTQLFINIIDPQTPTKVKYDIFRRINTGGKALNNQEIRNCLANTKTRELLSSLSSSQSFKNATNGSIHSNRMADEELILRFIAFYLIDNQLSSVDVYKGGMNNLLDITIEDLNHSSTQLLLQIRKAFINAMDNAYLIFGNKAFRKANYINNSNFPHP